MRALSASAIALVFTTGCAVTCIEDAGGKTCTAKSLKRFDGAPPAVQVLERAPGAPVTIDVVYGNVLVQRSTSGKVEVQFAPYDYAGYDDKVGADRELAQNLRVGAVASGGINVSVARAGGSTGLGADTTVRLPDDFDGPLTVVNHGDGPLNEFDVRIEFVGRSSAIRVENQSLLGDCSIQGAPTVHSTSVQCGERISVLDVSDSVSITATDEMYDEPAPVVTLRLAGVSPTATGGKVVSTSGSISATLPRGGGYVVSARSPVKGAVREGALPPGCNVHGAPNAKTIACAKGPTFAFTAGARPDYPGPQQNNDVVLGYR